MYFSTNWVTFTKYFNFTSIIYIFTTFKAEVVPVLNSVPYQEGTGGIGCVAACIIIINLGPWWEMSGQLHIHHFTLSTQWIRGWVQSEHCGEEKKLLPLPDVEPWFLSCPAQSLVIVPMEELSHTIMQSIPLIMGLSMGALMGSLSHVCC